MVTKEQEASTLDEYQRAMLSAIQRRGYYYYFLSQENARTATQCSSAFWSTEIRPNLLCLLAKREEDTAVSSLRDELIREDFLSVFHKFPAIQEHMQTHFHHQLNDMFSTLTRRISATDFQIEQIYHDLIGISSTSTRQVSATDLQIEQSAINIFHAYQHQEFDMDIAYEFTNALDGLIRANGKAAVLIINNLIKELVLADDIISETLKALGRIEDENTRHERYELLIGSIRNQSAVIRDGAVTALSFLDDKRALPQLRMLLETETVPILKNNIKVAINGLETY